MRFSSLYLDRSLSVTVASPSHCCLTCLTVSWTNYSDILACIWHCKTWFIDRPPPCLSHNKKSLHVCENNLCLQADSCVAVAARQLLMKAADSLPQRSSLLLSPIRFYSGIFTFDKQRGCSVCPRSTSLPLLTKLRRADWNLYPPTVTSSAHSPFPHTELSHTLTSSLQQLYSR